MNARDAFDEWLATEPSALHNQTIAEVWMAGYDRGRADERELHEPADPDSDSDSDSDLGSGPRLAAVKTYSPNPLIGYPPDLDGPAL